MPPPTAPARSLGSYEVVRKLGAGGMAEVFLASQHMTGEVRRNVVIKAMLPHLADDDHFVRMFLREARIAALLSHPNIVHIHDVSVIDKRPCIIMEFLRGRDMWHLLRRTAEKRDRIPPETAAAIVAQAATGLDYAHRKRDDKGQNLELVHRDISPHNLFITREGHVRVLDFGIAKSRYQQQRTQSGVLKGKLPYMAPEQARSKQIDARADQFALGVVLWEAVVMRRLFAREDPFQTMNALFHLEVPAPSSIIPTIPKELDRICMTALSRDRDQRFGTCAELADRLRTFIRSSSSRDENTLVAEALERAIPRVEDADFYGTDIQMTSTAVQIPMGGPHQMVGDDIDEEETILRSTDEPSHSGIGPTPLGVAANQRATELLKVPSSPPPAPASQPPPGLIPSPAMHEHAMPGMTAAPFAATAPTAPSGRASRSTLFALLGVFVAIALAIGVGVTLALTGVEDPPDEMRATPLPSQGPLPPRRVEVSFVGVTPDLVLEVDGSPLDGNVFSTVASDRSRRVRAYRDGHEVWRYDGVFRDSLTVEVAAPPRAPPEVAEPPPRTSSETPRPRMRRNQTAETPAMTPAMTTTTTMRLDDGLQTDYP